MAEVCVIGAGPAGCVFAGRMAQIGHQVRVIEHVRFPRPRLGESLSPGVEPLLAAAGFRGTLEACAITRVRNVLVKWPDGPRSREDPGAQGFIVDRGEFDSSLLERARALGARVLQPARLVDRSHSGARWRLTVDAEGREETFEVDLLADASGRASVRRSERTGAPTLAIYAYWRAARAPTQPRIEAGNDTWFWGVPLPSRLYNTLAFVDPKLFRASPGALAERFLELIARSGLLADCDGPELIGPVRAIDATPYLLTDCIDANSIRLGDAVLTIDPISSSGVQKAIQSALAGAIVANTLLRRPEATNAAVRFYCAHLSEASKRHQIWAAEHYRAVAGASGARFWTDRANGREKTGEPAPLKSVDAQTMAGTPVELSRDAAFIETPCLRGDFVGTATALHHPRLPAPVAFLEGFELAALLRDLPKGRTPLQIAHSWANRVPLDSGLAIAGWLVTRGVLVGSASPD
jgi:flavin-dependent dehydrogenase